MSGGIHFKGPHGGGVWATDDYAELRALLNPSRVALVMLPTRSGVRSFMTFLEYKYFPPATPLNHHFRFAIVKWGGLRWIVIIIHKKHLETADNLARLFGLRRANGIPHVISFDSVEGAQGVATTRDPRYAAMPFGELGGKVETFPLDSDNVWTMENIEGHFIYNNDPELERKAREFEDQACEQIIAEHELRRLAGEFGHEPGTMPIKRL